MRSYWLEEALAREPAEPEPLSGDLRTDVCNVGGGFTGMWTALRLKQLEPALDVTIIEKDICGGGASGRNGGFVMTWASKTPSLLKLCGGQETVRLVKASEEGVKAIGAFCREHDIDAQFRHDGWLWTATNAAQVGAWSGVIEALDRLGLHPYEALTPEEVAERNGSERHIAGVFEPGVATAQPALLARGLRRVCAARGIRIHEQTAMTGLTRETNPVVGTPRGSVRADKVVLALNAWAHELPAFRRTVLAIAVDALTTDAVPERLAELGLGDGVAISDSRLMVDYYRTTVDGRISIGKGGGPVPFAGRLGTRFDRPAARATEVHADLLKLYPSLRDVGIAATWQGPAARTATGLPFFGRLQGSPAVIYGHGYAGNGVGPSYTGGRILASLALERWDEWSECPLAQGPTGTLPPEPIRYVGGHLVRSAVKRKEVAEDQGKTPGRLDAWLAGFVPAGLTPTKSKPY